MLCLSSHLLDLARLYRYQKLFDEEENSDESTSASTSVYEEWPPNEWPPKPSPRSVQHCTAQRIPTCTTLYNDVVSTKSLHMIKKRSFKSHYVLYFVRDRLMTAKLIVLL